MNAAHDAALAHCVFIPPGQCPTQELWSFPLLLCGRHAAPNAWRSDGNATMDVNALGSRLGVDDHDGGSDGDDRDQTKRWKRDSRDIEEREQEKRDRRETEER